MIPNTDELLMEDSVLCPGCGDMVPRGHTVLRAERGRICWFCHTDERTDPDPGDEDWGDDDEDWDDWD